MSSVLCPAEHNPSNSSRSSDSTSLKTSQAQNRPDGLHAVPGHSRSVLPPPSSNLPQFQQSYSDPFSFLSHLDTSLSESSLISPPGTSFEHDSATSVSPDACSPSTEAPASPCTFKPRRKRPKIDLAPDQPLTTQGKPRTRVFSACLQCRTRKTRCDGGRPICHNCTRRPSDDACTYDVTPNRRGPDREPGARQRLKDLPSGPRRRRRRVTDTKNNSSADDEKRSTPISTVSLSESLPKVSEHDHDLGPSLTFNEASFFQDDPPLMDVLDFSDPATNISQLLDGPLYSQDLTSSLKPELFDPYLCNASTPYAVAYQAEDQENGGRQETIVDGPSMDFRRQTWWDALLSNYAHSSSSYHLPTLTSVERETASQRIMDDMRFLFRSTNYWFCFFNVPRFFATFSNPEKRIRMQPSLILAALSIATFLQSSEVEKGAKGRKDAMRLREEAQGALEASLNAGWLDESLVQAAWLIAFFEICAHPYHSSQRVLSALVILDSLVRSMSLSVLDAGDPRTTIFPPGSPPVVPSQQRDLTIQPQATGTCECAEHSLGRVWPAASNLTPLWLSTPAWSEEATEAELRKDQCRRLVWSSVMLIAGHTSYNAAHHQMSGLDLYLVDPSNYALLFPGESLASTAAQAKDSIWSLYIRAMMLWNSCLRMRRDPNVTDSEKAQFAMTAWLESYAMDDALDKHTCDIERSYMFLGREYLFNTRMWISYEFQRFVPHVTANVNFMFYRQKAEEWLNNQAAVVRHLKYGLSRVTGQAGGSMVHRPFFVFWFMGQMSRALTLWACDNTLTIALDVSKAMMAPVEYLMSLFPCHSQRVRYGILRDRLEKACVSAGVSLPPQANIANPNSQFNTT